MRIAFLSFSIVPFGSNDLLFFQTALLARELGHSVLISPNDWGTRPEYAHAQQCGIDIHWRPSYSPHSNLIRRQFQKVQYRLHDPEKDYRFLIEWGPDIVVISDPGTYHMLSAPGFADLLLRAGIPFLTISQYNNENQPIAPDRFELARRFFSKARSCVFVSDRNLQSAVRQLCLPLEQAVVVDNPPAISSFDAIPFPRSPEPAAMATVARLETGVKGQALILEILSRPAWRERSWVYNLYGQGPDEQYLRALIDFYDLGDRVTLHGQSNDVRQVWRENEILLLCSSGEGKPLALTEALLCGRPAVVTDVGGNAELVVEGVNGFVADSPTVNSFGLAMERAWAARNSWKSLGERGHATTAARMEVPPHRRLLSVITQASIAELQPQSR